MQYVERSNVFISFHITLRSTCTSHIRHRYSGRRSSGHRSFCMSRSGTWRSISQGLKTHITICSAHCSIMIIICCKTFGTSRNTPSVHITICKVCILVEVKYPFLVVQGANTSDTHAEIPICTKYLPFKYSEGYPYPSFLKRFLK